MGEFPHGFRISQCINLDTTNQKEVAISMKTVDELVYYCQECEPVGALLLSGEWGCGKTYLIEHELKDALADTSVILRISLFGMTLPEEIHAAIRFKWMEEYCRIKGISNVFEKLGQGKKWLSKMEFLPEWLRGIGKTDVSELFNIGKEMEGMTVVLVFDDLERCRMSSVDVLGIINDYCENQHYHTIIVANQAKIKMQREVTEITGEIQRVYAENNSRKTGENKAIIKVDIPIQPEQEELSYAEIKEKIIQRTVHYLPDYKEIVHAIIDDTTKSLDSQYREFIMDCEDGLLELFAPDRDDFKVKNSRDSDEKQSRPTPPHNIRSLKCAIKDFCRVYDILDSNNFPDIDKWLYSFTSYVIAYKAGIVKGDGCDSLFSDGDINKLYPAFQSSYTMSSVRQWILKGGWDEQSIRREAEIIKSRYRIHSASEIVKSCNIMDVDDAVLQDGFSELLDIAYKGNLSLDEYVLLIKNSCWSREYSIELPLPIDWKKVQLGIESCIDQIKRELPEGQILFSRIDETQQPLFTEEEWSTYKLISDFVFGNAYIFHKNKQLYIDEMNSRGASALTYLQNRRYDVFDSEMAQATAQAFEHEHNAGKNQFVSSFERIWKSNIMSPDIRYEDSIDGFRLLKSLLKETISKSAENKRTFSVVHTERFVKVLDALINSNTHETVKVSDTQ